MKGDQKIKFIDENNISKERNNKNDAKFSKIIEKISENYFILIKLFNLSFKIINLNKMLINNRNNINESNFNNVNINLNKNNNNINNNYFNYLNLNN